MKNEEIVKRIDRLEDHMIAQLNDIDNKIVDVLQSTVDTRARMEANAGSIKLLWTIVLACASGLAAIITSQFR